MTAVDYSCPHDDDGNARRSQILRFWRDVEYFSPSKVEGPDVKRPWEAKGRLRHSWVDDELSTPWSTEHAVRRTPIENDETWVHNVLGGRLTFATLKLRIDEAFPLPEDQWVERFEPKGATALFSLRVDDRGQPVFRDLVVSQAAWALGRLRSPGPGDDRWLDGFNTAQNHIRECFELEFDCLEMERRTQCEDTNVAGEPNCGRSHDYDATGAPVAYCDAPPIGLWILQRFLQIASETLGLTEEDIDSRVSAKSVRMKKTKIEDYRPGDLLNSMFVGDLRRCAAHASDPTLRTYLAGHDEVEDLSRYRLDVRASEHLGELLEALQPDRTPRGRWPSNPEHSLATSQQLATNEAMRRLRNEGGVFGVNGPPGTGKTTMLREIVAANVVERAFRLVKLSKPKDAFLSGTWPTVRVNDRNCFTVPLLRPELTGFEMVVASSNNGAVENVSKALPGRDSVHDEWQDADYFGDAASRLLKLTANDASNNAKSQSGKPLEGNAWGLLAAVLGNNVNRKALARELLFRKVEGSRVNSLAWLDLARRVDPSPQWKPAVERFTMAVAAEEGIRDRRQSAFKALAELPGAERRLAQAEEERRLADEAISVWRFESARREDVHREATLETGRVAESISRLMRVSPNLLSRIFRSAEFRRWADHKRDLRGNLLKAHSAEAEARVRLKEARNYVGQWEYLQAQRVATLAHMQMVRAELLARIECVREELAETGAEHSFPGERWFTDDFIRETSSPWSDTAWNRARTEVFLAALNLHRAFWLDSGKAGDQLLRAALNVVKEAPILGSNLQAVRAAWQGLFLLTPVVSTTFASVGRMFGDLESCDIGWLLVDEAGQAAPQQAVGAIWRAKRVIAVGDPLQLEPVVTTPEPVQARLCEHRSVDEFWMPGGTSMQEIVDRLTPVGTTLGRVSDELWVGAPLRVHRRCDDPMFAIVNSAVYGGLMVHGGDPTPEGNPSGALRPLPPSKWIDVVGAADGNWVESEWDEVKRILMHLSNHGEDGGKVPASEVMVVTPFRQVADALRDRIPQTLKAEYRRRGEELGKLGEKYGKDVTFGTVHVSQGKEADVVIFMLGGGKESARKWAASKPNLMNVAVSRAKRRLYVVGNYENWSHLPYFEELAQNLPRRLP